MSGSAAGVDLSRISRLRRCMNSTDFFTGAALRTRADRTDLPRWDCLMDDEVLLRR
jgi:hypothetical protein